jgi:hypothetical protein
MLARREEDDGWIVERFASLRGHRNNYGAVCRVAQQARRIGIRRTVMRMERPNQHNE